MGTLVLRMELLDAALHRHSNGNHSFGFFPAPGFFIVHFIERDISLSKSFIWIQPNQIPPQIHTMMVHTVDDFSSLDLFWPIDLHSYFGLHWQRCVGWPKNRSYDLTDTDRFGCIDPKISNRTAS